MDTIQIVLDKKLLLAAVRAALCFSLGCDGTYM